MPTPRKQTSSRQLQREQTRSRILAAAVKLFARSGFEAASLAGIARSAGLNKALVQYHFATKKQLWRECATHLWSRRNEHMAQVFADACDDDLTVRMRKGFTRLVEFTRENPQWLWFMFHEAAANSDRLEWLTENFLREDYRLGEEFVVLFQQKGLIRAGSSLHLLHLISGALTYNLLVAPQTLRVTGTDLASADAIADQVALLQSLLAPQGA